MKVYSLLSLVRNLENFFRSKESNTLVTLYWFVRRILPCTDTGVGYCLFVPRYSRTSNQIDE